jgi:hypothetical protein
MMPDLATIARQYDAFEPVDISTFQRRSRILQSMWRDDHGFPIGIADGRRYGARLETAWAKATLANFIGETAKNAVRNEVLDPVKSEGKLYGKPRIFDNLLSSQPLQQIWRDHLLACSVLQHGDYDEGAFAFLYPEQNLHCRDAIVGYRECLAREDTFLAWTLEDAWKAGSSCLGGEWGKLFFARYLDFDRVIRKERHHEGDQG